MQEEQKNIQPLALKGKKAEFVLDPKLKKKTVKSKKKVARSLKHDLLKNYGFHLVEN